MNLESYLPSAKGAEGWSSVVYLDTTSNLTIGWGHNLCHIEVLSGGRVKITPVRGISPAIGEQLLLQDVLDHLEELRRALPWWDLLDDVRQEVLLDMAFNMGVPGLLKWKETLALVKAGQYTAAAARMERQPWYRQVGRRAVRLVAMMRDGKPRPPLQAKKSLKKFYILSATKKKRSRR